MALCRNTECDQQARGGDVKAHGKSCEGAVAVACGFTVTQCEHKMNPEKI